MFVLQRLRFPSKFYKPALRCVRCLPQKKHDIFRYEADVSRKNDIMEQINMHGGLNDLLKKYGHCPLATCKQAIEKAYILGLIGMQTYKECLEINKKSNKAKHHW